MLTLPESSGPHDSSNRLNNASPLTLPILWVSGKIRVEILRSVCVNSLEFAEISFTSFVPLCGCNNAAPMPKFEASHIA